MRSEQFVSGGRLGADGMAGDDGGRGAERLSGSGGSAGGCGKAGEVDPARSGGGGIFEEVGAERETRE